MSFLATWAFADSCDLFANWIVRAISFRDSDPHSDQVIHGVQSMSINPGRFLLWSDLNRLLVANHYENRLRAISGARSCVIAIKHHMKKALKMLNAKITTKDLIWYLKSYFCFKPKSYFLFQATESWFGKWCSGNVLFIGINWSIKMYVFSIQWPLLSLRSLESLKLSISQKSPHIAVLPASLNWFSPM